MLPKILLNSCVSGNKQTKIFEGNVLTGQKGHSKKFFCLVVWGFFLWFLFLGCFFNCLVQKKKKKKEKQQNCYFHHLGEVVWMCVRVCARVRSRWGAPGGGSRGAHRGRGRGP